MLDLVDSHAHLQEREFDADRDAVIERARAAGVTTIIVPGVDVATSETALELAARYRGIYATAGVHPHEAVHFESSADRLDALWSSAVAVGEIGLDYYRLHSPREAQIEAFKAQLDEAAVFKLPVVIHCRDAWDDLASILQPWALRVLREPQDDRKRPLGVLHYFDADLATAQRYAELGFLISIHTSVTHPKSSRLRDVVTSLPLDALLLETDSPYGAPQAYRGRRNEPAYVIEAAKQVAALKGVSVEEVAAATTANASRLFRLPQPAMPLGGAKS